MTSLSEGYYLSEVEKDKTLQDLTREQQNSVARFVFLQTRGLRGLLGEEQRKLAAWQEFNKELKDNLRKACGTGAAQNDEY